MKNATAADAVGYFSENVRAFEELYRSTPGFHERIEVWDKLLARYAVPGGLAVDLGSGAGTFSFRLAALGHRVVGVDGAPNMTAYCNAERDKRGLKDVQFREGRLPRIDETGLAGADLVISSSVIEYVPEFEETLALMSRLLKDGGTLILSMPNAHSFSRTYQRTKRAIKDRADVYRYILHYSSPEDLCRHMLPKGLSILEAHYYTHITRLSRLGRRLGLPSRWTGDLFVAVFRKNTAGGGKVQAALPA
jgi:2-polyprenyl-3-methyl-5-hydroxy-6-metoxy-1,4-benzoquinol methylase